MAASSGLRRKYEVFINFRGEDTRRGFVSHLHRALRRKPINAFIDDEDLRKGDRLSELLTAIRESTISIVVFSQNYASSPWCLKELVQILECKDTNNQIVLPIFYQVDPSDVRQRFAEAFAQHDREIAIRNVFLHMEEVRRLRIQQRIKRAELGAVNEDQENELPSFPSFIPFLPPLSSDNLKQYYAVCYSIIAGFILFGGLIAPSLELKLGIGGTSYKDFIVNMHLPLQLSQVDPIVASFSGGAVGVISALMVVEINNVKQQEHKRCKYCLGTGYLACACCSSSGTLVLTEPVSTVDGGNQPLSLPKTERCSNCSGAGKVMCPTCLCTGMAMASEHDPRIDPFD